jgi:hypothetical protein
LLALYGFSCQQAPTVEIVEVEATREREYGEATLLATIEDPRLRESSGVAPSWRQKDVYYTHNDSGDSARFFRFDSSGRVLAEFTLRGSRNVDWEDMESLVLDGMPYLYFGDIGDNNKRRSSITIYRVAEPTGDGGEIDAFNAYEVTYPDGPRDAEALMVHPKTGDIYIVEKVARQPSGVYKLTAPPRPGKYMLERIGEVRVGGEMEMAQLITGGSISPDGRHIALRTYLSSYEYKAPARFDDWTKATPMRIPGGMGMQTEAICYTRDDDGLIITSEMSPMLVTFIPRK